MIKHIMQLVWNRRRKNSILIMELFISFLVLFAVFSIGVNFLKNFLEERGFNYEQVYSVNLWWENESNKNILDKKIQIEAILKQNPEIEKFSFCSNNVPYGNSYSSMGLNFDNQSFIAEIFDVDDNFFDVLEIPIIKGSISKNDNVDKTARPILINTKAEQTIQQKGSSVLNKIITNGGENENFRKYKIIGIIGNYKYGNDFYKVENQAFRQVGRLDTMANLNSILLKINSSENAQFEAKLQSDLTKIAPDWTIKITLLNNRRKEVNSSTLMPFLIFAIISGFLIFNVALGIFGVLWYNISKRKSEIGLRRAMGANMSKIRFQFLGEMWSITLFSVFLGIIIAVQFPALGLFSAKPQLYIQGILISILFIFILVTICAYFPSTQAAKIQPADALRDE